MKYTPISISPNKAQFLETRKFQINEIARFLRVPPHMIGDLEKSSFSNIEQQSLEFVKYTLDPWVARWEQAIVRRLLTEKEIQKLFLEALNKLVKNKKEIISNQKEMAKIIFDTSALEIEKIKLEEELNIVAEQLND